MCQTLLPIEVECYSSNSGYLDTVSLQGMTHAPIPPGIICMWICYLDNYIYSVSLCDQISICKLARQSWCTCQQIWCIPGQENCSHEQKRQEEAELGDLSS